MMVSERGIAFYKHEILNSDRDRRMSVFRNIFRIFLILNRILELIHSNP
jgi:hypothetical protein